MLIVAAAAAAFLASPGSASAFVATEGQPWTGDVGSFTDPCPYYGTIKTGYRWDCAQENPTATIAWGDGSIGGGDLTNTGCTSTACTYDVSGTYTYSEENAPPGCSTSDCTNGGAYATSIMWSDYTFGAVNPSRGGTVDGDPAVVDDAPVTVEPTQAFGPGGVHLSEGQSCASPFEVATLSDSGDGPASYFTVAIDWGDGTTSDGTLTAGSDAGDYTISGCHSYAEDGPFTVTVGVSDVGGATGSGQFSIVVDEPPIVIDPQPVAGVEGGPIGNGGLVATFTHNGGEPASDFAATVDWGDGAKGTGVISATASGYDVTASHSYTEEGSYPVKVTVSDDGGTHTATATTTAKIADAALSAQGTGITAIAGQPITGAVVAQFTDAGNGPASDFSAAINWGDGTSSAGAVSAQPGGGYRVTGGHTYAGSGAYPIKVTIADDGGQSATAQSTAQIASAASGGSTGGGAGGSGSGSGSASGSGSGSGLGGPTGGGRSVPTPSAPRCVVPKLIGRRLAAARRALARAHCSLGATAPEHVRRGRRAKVISQSPRAGVTRPARTKVNVVIGS